MSTCRTSELCDCHNDDRWCLKRGCLGNTPAQIIHYPYCVFCGEIIKIAVDDFVDHLEAHLAEAQ